MFPVKTISKKRWDYLGKSLDGPNKYGLRISRKAIAFPVQVHGFRLEQMLCEQVGNC